MHVTLAKALVTDHRTVRTKEGARLHRSPASSAMERDISLDNIRIDCAVAMRQYEHATNINIGAVAVVPITALLTLILMTPVSDGEIIATALGGATIAMVTTRIVGRVPDVAIV